MSGVLLMNAGCASLNRPSDDVVVTIDDKKITHGEIMQGVKMNLEQISQMLPQQHPSKNLIYKNVTDTLVANILLTKAAEKLSLTVSDEDLAKEIATIEAAAPKGTSLKDALAENKIDYAEWKTDLRKQMMVRKLVDEKTTDIVAASPSEIAKFYKENIYSFKVPETVTASQILLAFTPEDTAATKAQKKKDIQQIRAGLLAGDDFATIAKEKSDCPSSKNGGDLGGSFPRGQMVPEFETAAFSQAIGAVGDVVETQYGYHLIKVSKHERAGIRSLADATEQIQGLITGTKKQKLLLAYIEDLKKQSVIKYY